VLVRLALLTQLAISINLFGASVGYIVGGAELLILTMEVGYNKQQQPKKLPTDCSNDK
jgi:hypothetical protein